MVCLIYSYALSSQALSVQAMSTCVTGNSCDMGMRNLPDAAQGLRDGGIYIKQIMNVHGTSVM